MEAVSYQNVIWYLGVLKYLKIIYSSASTEQISSFYCVGAYLMMKMIQNSSFDFLSCFDFTHSWMYLHNQRALYIDPALCHISKSCFKPNKQTNVEYKDNAKVNQALVNKPTKAVEILML